jgi:hypothetical protein
MISGRFALRVLCLWSIRPIIREALSTGAVCFFGILKSNSFITEVVVDFNRDEVKTRDDNLGD